MTKRYSRRQALKTLGAVSATAAFPLGLKAQVQSQPKQLRVTGRAVEIQITSVSPHTFRLIVLREGTGLLASDVSLVRSDWGKPVARFSGAFDHQHVKCGEVNIEIHPDPLSFRVSDSRTQLLQKLDIDSQTGSLSFITGDSPLLGLGEGGPQFDRRNSIDEMRSGQGGYELGTHGGRVPIPWIIGTAGWAMFIHQPFGTFDFTGAESKFHPQSPETALPLDLFFVSSTDPATIMAEYARLTGSPELPPLWSLGYQQSHRTLASREEVLAEAKTFREKKLPCDALIYLGTGFCPSGWNTENGSFSWNSNVFPDPKTILDQLHNDNFKVVLHAVILTDTLRGSARDRCQLATFDEEEAGCYWDAHRKNFAMGVDGWWPDEGDPLDITSRLVRNRMYWEGPQTDRPNERPYALHRNGYAGMQRYASFLWSGDVYSKWETLKRHIPIGINTALSGIPYWGTDIGGFVPTSEFTAELYLRWFQFGAFCPLFRCHGRTWKLRLPWGWNTGDPGPVEIRNYDGAAIPDSSQLRDTRVEPICRKYLELRYRMLPYLYSAVRECAMTGMPIMRALWLHFPDDLKAVACSDQYLWGKSVLVAPVVEKGATTRRVYLPRGAWYDFWTRERHEGGREISRPVDLETIPLYVREGSIVPMGPVKQYTGEKVNEPLSVWIYPGADGSFLLYEDDGTSFDHRKGEWMGIQMSWDNKRRTFSLQLVAGSRMREPRTRTITVDLSGVTRSVIFEGRPVEVSFQA